MGCFFLWLSLRSCVLFLWLGDFGSIVGDLQTKCKEKRKSVLRILTFFRGYGIIIVLTIEKGSLELIYDDMEDQTPCDVALLLALRTVAFAAARFFRIGRIGLRSGRKRYRSFPLSAV